VSSRRAVLLALAAAGCGPLPQPFRGNPGRTARRLARPPAYRIAVTEPADARLLEADARILVESLVEALAAQDLLVVSGPGLPLDWRLSLLTEWQGGIVLPRFILRDADGRLLGEVTARPMPGRDWVEGGPPVLRAVTAAVAPAIADLAAARDAERRTGDATTAGGPPIIRLLPVTGAPGDGNRSLTARMRERLTALGLRVQDGAEGAAFALSGQVTLAPVSRTQQRIEIVWTVSRRDGEDLGRVLQLNEIPAGSLNGLWGDVALVVAEEAAGGVRDVIANAGGLTPAPASTPGPAR